MSDAVESGPAIKVAALWKEYTLGAHVAGAGTLNEAFAKWISTWLPGAGQPDAGSSGKRARFWALRNVSFDVHRGEVVGLIGRNGAGKSTVLKVLSRITPPTRGRIEICGRVASLLEVGTGFHGELTGRENIFLNGAILGMAREEIVRRFDQIVAFAEVDRFLDTPVKRYSSGMYVRLAFSVAAHLEPDILIVDEVLAVGDASFQKKCLGAMESAARSGRTVLFVSHNMNAVRRLCSRALLFDHGQIVADGNPDEVISAHLALQHVESDVQGTVQLGPEFEYLRSVEVGTEPGGGEILPYSQPFSVRIGYRAPGGEDTFVLALRATDSLGNVLFTSWDTDSSRRGSMVQGASYLSECTVPGELLRPGTYTLTVLLRQKHHAEFTGDETVDIRVEISEIGCEQDPGRLGLLAPRLRWLTGSRAGWTAGRDAAASPSSTV